MLAIVFAAILQQAASGQVVWQTPPPPIPAAAPSAPTADLPPLPDFARADPYGYERAECSPLIRKAEESMEACQARVRMTLAAHLGDALPAGMAPGLRPRPAVRKPRAIATPFNAGPPPDPTARWRCCRSAPARPVLAPRPRAA